MLTMIGLSGSLRQGSLNSSLLRAAAELVPEDVALSIATIRGIPLYDGDLEAAEGIPAAVAALKDRIAGSDALLLATPEYNNSIPGVMKNAIDWLSRPAADTRRVFGGKPVALIGASPGGFGTILSQNAWLPVLRTLGAVVRGASDGAPRRKLFRCRRHVERSEGARRAARFPCGLLEVHRVDAYRDGSTSGTRRVTLTPTCRSAASWPARCAAWRSARPAASAEQSGGIGEVNTAVTQLDQMTQQNAALVEESAAAAESLREQASERSPVRRT